MEYYPNGSLLSYLNARNKETTEESIIKSYANQILCAMFNYSEKGVIHGNLKPENILIDNYSLLKVSDFSLEMWRNGNTELSSKENGYLSPEIKKGKIHSLSDDIWSFGVVILELSYGRNTFNESEISKMNPKKIKIEFERRGGYSNEMCSFVCKCFERKGRNRAKVIELLKDKWLQGILKTTIRSGIKNIIS